MLFHPSNGLLSSILSSVALVTLFVGMVLFIKYDCTRYEYILLERNGTLDFYVNKIVGKRGSYCVYFPLTDCIEIGLFDENVRNSIRAKYPKSRFPKYAQNFISARELYYALFTGPEFYDCVILECDEQFISLMKEYMGKAPTSTLHNDGETENEINVDMPAERNRNEDSSGENQ